MDKRNLEIEHFTSEVLHAYLEGHPRSAFSLDKVIVDFSRIAKAMLFLSFKKSPRYRFDHLKSDIYLLKL